MNTSKKRPESTALSLPAEELEVAAYWEQNKIFERSVSERPVTRSFSMYDGPPFATGLPHYGHALPHTIKDVVPRYQTMRGHRVERRWGWDCHGVPVEFEVEKQLGIPAREYVSRHGIAAFLDHCRSIVQRHVPEWRQMERRLGRFVDMDNDYRTMSLPYMESVWWVFKRLWERGLIYEGMKVVAYSPALGTSLSNFEAGLNYREVESLSVTVSFPLAGQPDTALLVWTTTPWSLPGNAAIALNRDSAYACVTTPEGKHYVLGADALHRYFDCDQVRVESVDPHDLMGKSYAPVFDTPPSASANIARCFRIVHSNHVLADEGTGLVHIAPAYGEDDFRVGQEHGLPALDPLDVSGVFTAAFSPAAGKGFRHASPAIAEALERSGRLFRKELIRHQYPCCWRSDEPLMYRAVPSWYLRVTALKDRLLANNSEVRWYPEAIGRNRFHKWLENARDWAISRDRYWGTPLPVWRCDRTNHVAVVGSAQELEQLTGRALKDLHRDHVDSLVVEREGALLRRVGPVLDCWFESGAMPYAQRHYPFENREAFEASFPADFVAEGVDQTRGWFYTMMVLSTALFDRPAFKNVVVNGVLLAGDGKKMSKRLRNYTPMDEVFDRHGADALRFYLLSSRAMKADDACVSEEQVRDVARDVLLPLRNVLRFYTEHATDAAAVGNTDVLDADGGLRLDGLRHPMDQWLSWRAERFRRKMEKAYDGYDLTAACLQVREFTSDLSNWYLRTSRGRLCGGDSVPDKTAAEEQSRARASLRHALLTVSLCAAPVLPFLSETIYRKLGAGESVHLDRWPKPVDVARFDGMAKAMVLARRVVSLGLRARKARNLRLRQPLPAAYLDAAEAAALNGLLPLVSEELNVKQVRTVDGVTGMLERKVTLNLPILGPLYGPRLPVLRRAVETGNYRLEPGYLLVDGLRLVPGEFTVEILGVGPLSAVEDNGLWVVLDTTITAELREEGALRDFIRQVQGLRKEAGYPVEACVMVAVEGGVSELLLRHKRVFCQQTLTVLRDKGQHAPDATAEVNADGYAGRVWLYYEDVANEDQ